MGVLIGIDPHKATNAVAAVDEHGELLEYAVFSTNRAGLRSLGRWGKRFAERRWAVEGAGGLGRSVALRLVAAGETVVDVPAKLASRARLLATGNARKNDRVDAFHVALAALRGERLADVGEEEHSEILRMLSEEAGGPHQGAHPHPQPPARAASRSLGRRSSEEPLCREGRSRAARRAPARRSRTYPEKVGLGPSPGRPAHRPAAS